MKVSILTQPLGRNYGGLLQAYALQVVLKRLGLSVETLNRNKSEPIKARFISRTKLSIKKILGGVGVRKYREPNVRPYSRLENFRDNFITISPLIDSDKKLIAYYSRKKFDAVIVGSDQVWRPRYSPKLTNYFLDFCDELTLPAKRIAYAASFGVDSREFSEQELALCRPLARKFDAISVREDSGVELVSDYFGLSSDLVFDPTLLLDYKDYEHVIELDRSDESVEQAGLLAYILDMDSKKETFVSEVSDEIGMPPSYLMNQPDNSGDRFYKENMYPSVGDWLNKFKSASFVVTDSFHGCVFSIIFNKPFLVIGNKSRGLARFNSLLRSLGLQRRLILETDAFDRSIIDEPIDWEGVKRRHSEGREKSIRFIKKCFGV